MAKAKKQKSPPGNPRIVELGRNTRFAKGQSGNPGGRPKRTPYADAHRYVAELASSELRVSAQDSVAISIAKTMARQAIRGSAGTINEPTNLRLRWQLPFGHSKWNVSFIARKRFPPASKIPAKAKDSRSGSSNEAVESCGQCSRETARELTTKILECDRDAS